MGRALAFGPTPKTGLQEKATSSVSPFAPECNTIVVFTILVYYINVHVIAKPILVEFWTKHPDAEPSLDAWYRIMKTGVYADFNDLRATFASADYVDGLTVFNIGGNKYRLIASIHYNRHKVYIRAVLTHEEYDREGWKRKRRN